MSRPSVLMVGTGEYTTGYVHNGASGSDKSAGVVALSLFDMRRRGKVGRLMMAGTNGNKFPHFADICKTSSPAVYKDLTLHSRAFQTTVLATIRRPIWRRWTSSKPGDIVTVFTPDDTHFGIAMEGGRARAARADRQADRQDVGGASCAGRSGPPQRRAWWRWKFTSGGTRFTPMPATAFANSATSASSRRS